MNDQSGSLAVPDEPVTRSPRSRRNAIITLIVLVGLAVVIWAATRGGDDKSGHGGAGGRGGRGGRPTATVGTAKVVAADVPQTLSAIGTVTPIVVATVRPQLSGNIFTINFTEGQIVAKGQLLAQIDPRPYRLALAQAQANLARDESQLNLARTDLRRYQTLLAQDSVARQTVDTQVATVKQNEGTVGADRAAVGTARLNLQYTSVTAPVAGRVGLRQADIGNYVTPSDTNGIAVVTQTTPIDVAFSVPQANLPGIQRARVGDRTLPVTATDQAGTTTLAQGSFLTFDNQIDVAFSVPQANLPGIQRARMGDRALPVTATDQAGTTTLAQGSFLTFDNQIDSTTGTVKAKARFANPSGKLFPNQFVNVSLQVETLHNVPTIPVTAVRHGTQGDFVFLLQPDRTVKMRTVKLGPAAGTNTAILSGVAVGDTVITEGADNLDDGSKVMLPGDKPQWQRPEKKGFFARLFGGGGSDKGADGNTQGAADGGGEHRHRRGDGQGQANRGGQG